MDDVLRIPYTQIGIPVCPAFPSGELRDYPLIPVALYHNGVTVDFLAVIDSGADHCVFPSIFADRVGIRVMRESRRPLLGRQAPARPSTIKFT